MKRCKWCNLSNQLYVKYHDEEWGRPVFDEKVLFEFLVLESFQAGLSWQTILNKRKDFRVAFDNFDAQKISLYDQNKIYQLMNNELIIRNRRKINATIINAKIFLNIQKEWGSFSNYIWHFTDGKIIYENDKTYSPLSDLISADLKSRGMCFVGTTIIYSYLQAMGIIHSHDTECFLYEKKPCQ